MAKRSRRSREDVLLKRAATLRRPATAAFLGVGTSAALTAYPDDVKAFVESLEDLDRRLETRGWRFAADVSTPDCLTWDSPGPNAATSSLVLSGLGDDDEPLPRERWVFEISSELPDGSEDVVSLDWSTFSPRLDDAGDNHAGSDDAPSSIN